MDASVGNFTYLQKYRTILFIGPRLHLQATSREVKQRDGLGLMKMSLAAF